MEIALSAFSWLATGSNGTQTHTERQTPMPIDRHLCLYTGLQRSHSWAGMITWPRGSKLGQKPNAAAALLVSLARCNFDLFFWRVPPREIWLLFWLLLIYKQRALLLLLLQRVQLLFGMKNAYIIGLWYLAAVCCGLKARAHTVAQAGARPANSIVGKHVVG